MSIITCISDDHNLWLLLLALTVCVGGSWVALELYRRAGQRVERQRTGWLFLAGVAAGCSVWCTHFVAMLAYRNDVPAVFDPLLTVASLVVVIPGITVSFQIGLAAGSVRRIPTWLLAGLLLGVSVSAMHYLGMFAYRVDGLLIWNPAYIVASIVLACLFACVSIALERRARPLLALGAFSLCILSLHFTGMAALAVVPSGLGGSEAASSSVVGLAIAVTCGALLIAATGAASHMIDSDANEKALGALREMALTDALTGLPNRHSFSRFLELKLARARSEGRRFAVVMIDLDKFKAVNDVHGHQGGDEMLRAVAARMRTALQPGDFLARMGGDEFAAICPTPPGQPTRGFIDRLEATLAAPVRINAHDVLLKASFGVSFYPQDGDGAAQILSNADLALYRSKADPGRGVSYYDPSMDEAARARRELVLELRRALGAGEFELHYQVQARVIAGDGVPGTPRGLGPATTDVIGYEALLRWKHPTRGYIPPADFIPLAEESGLILPIGEWVIRAACREAAGWSVPHRVAVNLSPLQIAHSDVPHIVASVLRETGLEPARLELEITETSIIEDRAHCLEALTAIRKLGVTIAIDDFGTGYSSLATLRAFPFHRIKLDRSFMSDIAASPESQAILRAVLALGRSLNIRVLAEGVETMEQLQFLETEGCCEVQGFLFGRPGRAVVN